MPDTAQSVHRLPFDYQHPDYRAAAAEAKCRSQGHCQNCGYHAPSTPTIGASGTRRPTGRRPPT